MSEVGTYIHSVVEGFRAVVEIRRAEARNALDGDGWRAIAEAAERYGHDDAVRVIVLRGVGEVFCAGGDVDWMRRASTDELALVGHALSGLAACPKPVIARVHGSAYGGGVGLLAACDVAVASDTARFALSEVRVGVAPAIVSRVTVRRIGGARFRAWALTGRAVTADEALAAGLVDLVVPPERLDSTVDEVVASLAAGEPAALAEVKRMFPNGLDDAEAVATLARLRARPEFAEGIAALREKRRAAWVRE